MKNWKTTLFGGLAAVFGGLASVPAFAEYSGILTALAAVAAALFAFFSKDSNVTGGTVNQNDPPIPPKG